MSKELTIHLFADGVWQDAYSLKFKDLLNPREGTCITGNLTPFYVNKLDARLKEWGLI